jgi:hypothetical protein
MCSEGYEKCGYWIAVKSGKKKNFAGCIVSTYCGRGGYYAG